MTVANARTFAGMMLASTALLACGPDYPNCDDDDDCKDKEFCVNGRCQQCRDDGDCPVGNQCSQGRCEAIPDYCRSDADCGPNERCLGNRCQTPQRAADDGISEDTGAGGCQIESVYFEFDSSTISPEARTQIQENIECMQRRNIGGLHLTGHADPRGTEEYNLALGDRRAQSVRSIAKTMGIDNDKISVSSMGEEMAQGTDESSWAKDRRVEFSGR